MHTGANTVRQTQARVEGAISYVKQHSRVAMLAANVPTRFWPQVTTDFVHKKNYLWYSEDASGTWSTVYERMQPVFAVTRDTVAVVVSRAFFLFFPCNHIINIKKNLFPAKQKTA
jgi:hypothetical protein